MQIHSLFSRCLVGTALVSFVLAGCGNKAEEAATETTPAIPKPVPPVSLEETKDPAMVIATVNGTDITQGQLDKEIANMMQRMQGRVPPERLGQMRAQMQAQMLDNLVNRQVITDKITADNITISDEEFDAAVAELTANLPEGATLEMMLAQAGSTEEEFRQNFGMELKVRKLVESHSGGKVESTEEEAMEFYNTNQDQFKKPESASASHILLAVEADASDDEKAAKRAELEAIRTKLTEGADFAEMAMEHSTCPSKAQGGSLGDFTRGRMVPEFEAAAFSQEIGEVGEIVETQFGYHLIKVTERSDASATPFEEVKEQLIRYLSAQKQQKAAQALIEGWVEEANVSYPGK